MRELAAGLRDPLLLPCDVTSDAQIDALFATLGSEWGGLDGVLHSIAFAPREALAGDFLEGLSRDAFRVAHEVSSYSFAALARGARPHEPATVRHARDRWRVRCAIAMDGL